MSNRELFRRIHHTLYVAAMLLLAFSLLMFAAALFYLLLAMAGGHYAPIAISCGLVTFIALWAGWESSGRHRSNP